MVSRSRRHTPITGITKARSEKDFKRQTHQSFRTKQRVILKKVLDSEDHEVLLPQRNNEVENLWSGPKDGKSSFGGLKKKKPRYFDKLMRK